MLWSPSCLLFDWQEFAHCLLFNANLHSGSQDYIDTQGIHQIIYGTQMSNSIKI